MGKSILARHLAALLRDGDRLACLVNAKANSTDDPSKIVRMMSQKLAALHPRCSAAVASGLKQGPQMDSFSRNFEACLIKPIDSLRIPTPLIFIIDALDEWNHYEGFLDALVEYKELGNRMRFIFTSRNNNRIETLLRRLTHHHHSIKRVSDDIMKSYIWRELSDIPWEKNFTPDDKAVDSLVKRAQGLFIWAATACRSIRFAEGLTPAEELDTIISSPGEVVNLLQKLYSSGLDHIMEPPLDAKTVRKVLRVLVAMQNKLPSACVAKFAGVEETDVKTLHRRLYTFYMTQELDKDVLSPLHSTTHSSFRHFLFSPAANKASSSKVQHPLVTRRWSPAFEHSKLFDVCREHLQTNKILFKSPQDAAFEDYILRYWMMHRFSATAVGKFRLNKILNEHLKILRRMISPESSAEKLPFTPFSCSFRVILSSIKSQKSHAVDMNSLLLYIGQPTLRPVRIFFLDIALEPHQTQTGSRCPSIQDDPVH